MVATRVVVRAATRAATRVATRAATSASAVATTGQSGHGSWAFGLGVRPWTSEGPGCSLDWWGVGQTFRARGQTGMLSVRIWGGGRVGWLGLGVRSSSTEGRDCSLFVGQTGVLRMYYVVGGVGDMAFFVAL